MRERRIGQHPVLPVPAGDYVEFMFDGQPLRARAGEVISSAAIASGIEVFNFHQRDGAPQGIFCANGQCAQCLVLVDGVPRKACITPVQEGMDVRTIKGLPELLADDAPVEPGTVPVVDTDVLIVGAGPAGMAAAAELAPAGLRIIMADDKQEMGGKLGLQTHNFFGSIRDCHAGMRGMDIGRLMADEVLAHENVNVWLESPVVGVFSDGLVGVVRSGIYHLVRPRYLLITAGAREKTLAFPGSDLPGVYGAGAFQTLVNRDLVRASDRLFIVGGGNVGLIAAYHALQAGIEVLGIVEALPQCGGYKVHLDKVKRLGIPVWTSHTVLRAEGEGHVERVTIAQIDENFRPVPGTERTLEVDTLLVAVGLAPVNELLLKAREFGMRVYAAGDADMIAEASAAMFSGRIAGRSMLRDMGHEVEVPGEWHEILDMLRARPGEIHDLRIIKPQDSTTYPVIRCIQEIPCNPCTEVCPVSAIRMHNGRMNGVPEFTGQCVGCARCVTICPGLAITLVDRGYDPSGKLALVTTPWELPPEVVKQGDTVTTTGLEGEPIGQGRVIAVKDAPWQNRRRLMLLEVPAEDADRVAGIRVYEPSGPGTGTGLDPAEEGGTIICRCERITRGEIVSYIRETGCTDFNALKAALRVGMGPCGGKTCTDLVMRIFRQELGRDVTVEPHVERPFTQEVPLTAFLAGVSEEGGDGQ